MFEIKKLSKQYGGEFALRDITMHIGKGLNFIVGASGSGKSTLLKILSGIENGSEGSVTYLGKNIEKVTAAERSTLYNSTFGFIWQDFHLLSEATVLENILLPAYLKGDNAQKTAKKFLKQFELEDLGNQKVKFLSGGQKQRVVIARELMKNPQVIFCDEPTSALDVKSAKIIMDILRNLSKSRTVIIVTHDSSLIEEKDSVFKLDKGKLVSVTNRQNTSRTVWKSLTKSCLSFKNACSIAFRNLKNKPGRFCVSASSLMIAGTLLLTTFSGAVGKSSQAEFDKLVETYGEGILDMSLIESFMSAGGSDGADSGPSGNVEQNLSGLYEKYQQDERVEFIVSAQTFENIKVTVDGETHTVENTGNAPVLTKLLSGDVPAGKEFQAVVPLKFAESIGLTPKTALGKQIDFSATIFQWVNDQPIEKPVNIRATICGVADNTVVYDYEGKPYSFTVDDSFFFNLSAIEEVRKQAGIEEESANFTIRAKTPADLISLKDELNKSGIVPLGRFELVEDMVRLNQQTSEQSGSAGAVIGILAILLAVIVFVMTSVLRKREYAIYKVSGYGNGHLIKIAATETLLSSLAAVLLMLITAPLLNMATKTMFNTTILSIEKLAIGAALISGVSVIAFVSTLPAILTSSVSAILKAGEKF